MSQVILYRQSWMATLKDRRVCQICNDLAINSLEFKDENGTCNSVSWFLRLRPSVCGLCMETFV